MIPALGFAVYSQFDKADRLLESIDYPVEHLVIVDNSGQKSWKPTQPEKVKNLWFIQVPYGLGLVGAWNLVIKSTPYAPYWVLVNDDAWFESGALEIIAKNVNTNSLNFVDIVPQWSCVVFGEGAIAKAGIYDERLYPLYFDDNDLQRRMENAGVVIHQIKAKVHHENSSSLSGKTRENGRSFRNNENLFNKKVQENDNSLGHWDLTIRRENRWD